MRSLNNCAICGRAATEIHHIMNGTAYRKKSEEDGFVIPVCRPCHEFLHRNRTARLREKAKAERIYLKTHTLEEWIKRYGKNYID